MPPAYEILLLNTAVPQIQAAQSGDTYVVPRDIAFSTVANLANGTNLLPSLTFSSDTNTGIYREGADALGFTAGGGTNQMVLTSTGLGIGTNNPGYRLHVVKPSAGITARFTDGDGVTDIYGYGLEVNRSIAYVKSSGALHLGSAVGYSAAVLDSSGNLGLGVTPSAWRSGDRAFDIGGISALADVQAAATRLVSNAYGVSGGVYIYKTNNFASYYNQQSGQHAWFTAPSGTANSASVTSGASYTVVALGSSTLAQWQAFFNDSSNNPLTVTPTLGQVLTGNATGTLLGGGLVTQNISFTQAMTLDASGNLLLGTTSRLVNYGHEIVVNGTAGEPEGFVAIRGERTADGNLGAFKFYNSSNSMGGIAARRSGADNSSALTFSTSNAGNDTERARITSGGDFQTASGNSVMVGGTAARATTAGTNRVDIFDGTAPVGTLANGVSFYSASGEANVMDAAGNATLLSPHDAETNEWIFRSKHTPTGKVLKIDVERLLKFVNDHFGLDAVHEFVEK